MASGYVALLDVLGFSNLVADDATGERVERYLECLQRTKEDTEVDYVVFSDSIVLTVAGGGPDSLLAIAGACSRLTSELLSEGIPVRGAISHGPFVRSAIAESVFVAGRAVIDAYRFEQLQDWSGIMIAPSALANVPDLKERCQLEGYTHDVEMFRICVEPRFAWATYVQPCHLIPFHRTRDQLDDSNFFDGFAIVPTNGFLTPLPVRDSIEKAIGRLKWLRSIAPTPSAQRKYQKAINWLEPVERLWHDVVFRHQQIP